jgi:hypothetical protein
MRKIQLLTATVLVSLSFSTWANSQTVLPLNTGFNHSTGSVYPPATQDNYWINLATSLPTTPPTGPSWTIQAVSPWQPALPPMTGIPGTSWISAWNTIGGKVDPVTKRGYSIFRKCFCLMSFTQAKMAFDVRADDNITVWLNTTLNTILPASPGGFSNPTPLHAGTTDQGKFHVGVNCLYVLLEDLGGYMGFDLRGTMSAFGLMPMPASGTEVSFKPCDCNFSPPGAGGGAAGEMRRGATDFDDRQVIQEIVKIAETGRAAKGRPSTK